MKIMRLPLFIAFALLLGPAYADEDIGGMTLRGMSQSELNYMNSRLNYSLNGTNTECAEGSVYDPAAGRCVNSCPPGQVWDDTTKQCKSGSCPAGQVFDPIYGNCTYSTNCPQGQVYDEAQKKCVSRCGENLAYDPIRNSCVPANQVCPAGKFFSTTTQQCVTRCGNNEVFNYSSGTCTPGTAGTCPAGQTWSGSMGSCVVVCPTGQTFDSETGECTQGTPTCSEGSTWNDQKHKCVSICPTGQAYSSVSKQCVAVHRFRKQPGGCPSGQSYNPLTEQCENVCLGGYIAVQVPNPEADDNRYAPRMITQYTCNTNNPCPPGSTMVNGVCSSSTVTGMDPSQYFGSVRDAQPVANPKRGTMKPGEYWGTIKSHTPGTKPEHIDDKSEWWGGAGSRPYNVTPPPAQP